MGAIGLVFILRTHEITGSFAAGGAATAAYALSLGLVAPGLGRLIDLKGQTLVLLGAALLQAAALFGFAALPGDAALPLIIALAALTGASQPPLGATVRSLWSRDLDEDTRHVLFTGESAVLEGIYIAGPVLIVAGIGGLHLDLGRGGGLRRVRADRDRHVRAHARVARVAPGARPRARARGRARLARRADAARHDGRARHRHRRHRGRGPGAVRARAARPARPASCSACGASAA